MSGKRIRVAHVVGSLNYGGAENQVIKVLNALNNKKIEKYLVTFSQVKIGLEKALSSQVHRYNLELTGLKQLWGVVKMWRFFKREQIDLVQSHMYHANLYACLAAKLAHVPVIITTEHGKNLWKKPHHHVIERFVINRLATLRVAVSKDIMNLRIKSDHTPKNKITVITNCVDIPRAFTRKFSQASLAIGTVGRLVEVKDYGNLLRASQKVLQQRNNVKVIFVGDGPERHNLEKIADSLGIAKQVEFVGWQSDVDHFLEKMDIFVLSSLREGIPVAMLEAMAKGIPVVATNVGGVPEVIEDGREGLLVKAGDPEKLARSLAYLLDNETLRLQFGKKARKKVIQLFSTSRICAIYEEIYESLLNGARHGLQP